MPKEVSKTTEGRSSGTLLSPIMPFATDWFEQFAPSLWRGFGHDSIKVEEYTKDGTLTIRAEAPGVDPDKDIDITVDDDVLRIDVRRSQKTEEHEDGNYHSEFRYGSFRRAVRLPSGTNADAVKAAYHDGILEVTVPVPEAKPTGRKVAVKR